MNLKYLPIDFKLRFENPATVDVNPLFILRSMLGKNLRSMCCISRGTSCGECMYNKTCVYAFLFETILSQKNTLLPGTDRASHPFSFSIKKIQKTNPITNYEFTITLFGKATEYLPYIYAAFVRSGKDGLFKNRTSFIVEDVHVDGKKMLLGENQISTDFETKELNFDSINATENSIENEILFELKSPLRFKFGGKYGTDFSASDFMKCLYRRCKTLCSLYGEFYNEDYVPSESLQIIERNIYWKNYRHYSARQKTAMELGGSVGSFKIVGKFTQFELFMIELNRIANAGKNTNFGLGQIDYWKR